MSGVRDQQSDCSCKGPKRQSAPECRSYLSSYAGEDIQIPMEEKRKSSPLIKQTRVARKSSASELFVYSEYPLTPPLRGDVPYAHVVWTHPPKLPASLDRVCKPPPSAIGCSFPTSSGAVSAEGATAADGSGGSSARSGDIDSASGWVASTAAAAEVAVVVVEEAGLVPRFS